MSEQFDNDPGNSGRHFPAFWRIVAAAFAGVIILAALLNFIVDPYGIYGVHLLPRTEINFYEKKLELFSNYQPPAEALIVGSSRGIALDPDMVEELTGKRAFNFSVPGAKAETFYATLRLAVEDFGDPVDELILAVDPESFHPTMPIQPESVYMAQCSRYFIYNPDVQAGWAERVGLLFTLDQTSESIDSLGSVLKASMGRQKMEFRDDGYSTWVQREREIAEGTYNLESVLETRIRKYPERSLMLSSFTHLGETRMKYWEDFLDLCEERGVKVYAFLPPYHPRLSEVLHNFGADGILSEVSEYLEATVESHGGAYRDFRDIRSFGGDPNLFYDEIHMRPENATLLLENLLGADDSGESR